MMLKLSCKNLTKVKIPEKLNLMKWLRKTVEVLEKKEVKGEIELYFVKAEEIKKLNKEHRGINKVTDVLSFSFLEEERFSSEDLVGQVFIEPITAKKQAIEHGVKWRDEIEFLWVHALLHIFGYDHEKKEDFKQMFALQARIMPGQKWEIFVEQIYREYFA